MNILLTCAGRRAYLVDFFKKAAAGNGQVFACDAAPEAPALRQADKSFVVPPASDENYIDALLAICEEYRVGLLVPALEPELPLLAAHRDRFAAIGTLPLVSSPQVIATCYDKLATAEFLMGCGLLVPRTFTRVDAAREAVAAGLVSFPLVLKPRWGVSSIAMQYPEDDEDLDFAWRITKKQIFRSLIAEISATDPERCILIQERLAGSEYGLDIINDLRGRYICTFAKRKIRIRAGQADRAVTVADDRLEKLGATIGRNLGHVGVLDCDVFVNERGAFVIDINPRIGGGYPFSHVAGTNIPAALIAWANGEEPDPEWFHMKPDVTASRCDTFVITEHEPVEPGTCQQRQDPAK